MFRAERKLHVLHGDIAFLFELDTSTSGDLEGGGPRTCTLSTMGTVQLAFSGPLAQPPKCPTDRINKTRTPIASSLLFLNWLQKKYLDTVSKKRIGIKDRPTRLRDAYIKRAVIRAHGHGRGTSTSSQAQHGGIAKSTAGLPRNQRS